MEFLDRTTTIDKPFYQYDPLQQCEVADSVTDKGITVMGVDILPSELPLESSRHFGDKLMSVLDQLISVKMQNVDVKGIPTHALGSGIAPAVITTARGSLTMRYRYLHQLIQSARRKEPSKESLLTLRLEGHLFDTGVINLILDAVEQQGYGVHLGEFVLPQHRPQDRIKSSLQLTITDRNGEKISVDTLQAQLLSILATSPAADATMVVVDAGKLAGGKAHVSGGDPVRKVLVLGSGFVARSALESLARSNVQVTLVSNDPSEAADLASSFGNVEYAVLEAGEDQDRLSSLMRKCSVVVSLLPAPMHPLIAGLCISTKTSLVTSSYESDEMREMEGRMKESGILCLNEVGLDPGLDHMSAMKIIDDVHDRGGAILSFSSVCGGLPSPEDSDNPFGYKFSWSPRGVIRASSAPARFLLDDKTVDISGPDLLHHARPFTEYWPAMGLEVLPNRDSLRYADIYGIADARSIFRGTLRYSGFSSLLLTLRNMGLLDEHTSTKDTWDKTLLELCHRRGFKHLDDFALACSDEDPSEACRAVQALQWLGILGESATAAPAVVDAFCSVLEKQLCYKEHEKDMVLMHHSIQAVFDHGTEHHVSTLRVTGEPGSSAMSRTVGYTAAAAVQLVLSSPHLPRGLLLPTVPDIYVPILKAVAKDGIEFEESIRQQDDRHWSTEQQRSRDQLLERTRL
jgi:saccharopine dehydrogenase-like NADP-dependent oxidoreductase